MKRILVFCIMLHLLQTCFIRLTFLIRMNLPYLNMQICLIKLPAKFSYSKIIKGNRIISKCI